MDDRLFRNRPLDQCSFVTPKRVSNEQEAVLEGRGGREGRGREKNSGALMAREETKRITSSVELK